MADNDSSGPNSPRESEQGKKSKNNTIKRLRNLGLDDNSTSLFMSDFDPKQVRPSNLASPSSVSIKY